MPSHAASIRSRPLPEGVTIDASGPSGSYRDAPDALDRAVLALEMQRVGAPSRRMTDERIAWLATFASSGGAGLAIWIAGASAAWTIAAPAVVGVIALSLSQAQARRGPQRVEIGMRTIRIWRNSNAREALTTVPRGSVRAITLASRGDGSLRAIDVRDPPLHAALHVVIRHASGAPTPLVEDITSLDDAIAIARALHAPLGHAVALELPGETGSST